MNVDEARAAADQHPVGKLLRVQLDLLNTQILFLEDQRIALEAQISTLGEQYYQLSDRAYYLRLCFQYPDRMTYSEEGYYRYQRSKEMYGLSVKKLKAMGKRYSLEVPSDPKQDDFINALITAELAEQKASMEVNNEPLD
jgi:hypothetical protein